MRRERWFPIGMAGYQNADSGMALAFGTDKLLAMGRRCPDGGERGGGCGS